MFLGSDIGALPSRAQQWGLTRILPREAKETSECHDTANSNTCEKPGMSTGEILLVLGIASFIIVLGLLVLLFVFHRRKQRLDKLEDIKGVEEQDDYGLAPIKPRLPQAPPPTYERSQDRKADGHWERSPRDSTDSLTPSLRQAMGVTPRDTLANSR
ncbi:hypothetical protein FHETE_1591 [Fusarium heterosporum]|uniref:Uncharacterized protein n=1 Tax=Fusarium heterosporum TaxID=42747 RepID=A0A8H5X094_FUSHE|nr:hypothetical protein FHETE_1591 [Fusarium heterosporum]